MGAIDFGEQTISVDYYDPADSHIVNLRHMGVRKAGIYSGGYLTKVSNVAVSLSALICEIKDDDYQVKVKTAATVDSVTVGVATPYVVLRWAYAGAVDNYMDVLGVAEGSIQDNDLIVGKCNFAGATLTGFDYSERTTPEVFDLFLRVEPTAPASMTVRVRAGKINFGSENFDIVDQVTSAIAAPGSGSRIDLIYVDTDGVVKIKAGTADPSPSAPDYESRAVLAEVTIASTATEITEDDIKRVRAFVVPSLVTVTDYTADTDTDVKSKSWTIDENDMASDLDTKVPTQQSVKAYVDDEVGEKSEVSVLAGTISHGGTIPLPSGYTEEQCEWTVSLGHLTAGSSSYGYEEIEFTVNSSRVVTVRKCNSGGGCSTGAGVANYIIIGVK